MAGVHVRRSLNRLCIRPILLEKRAKRKVETFSLAGNKIGTKITQDLHFF
jgi:hypothetical protein